MKDALAQWIAENTTQKELAAKIGCAESYLSQIANGHRVPSLQLAKRISRATGGEVPTDALAP
jgi:DNA-binding transcriptional regulator YdaS (Cro superfamily)